MRTYKTSIEKPRLVISYDNDTESPRSWTNLGYFLTSESNYKSPDGNDNSLYQIMIETGEDAISTDDHMKRIKTEAKANGINILKIYPVNRYEHGNVRYSIGEVHGWDHSNCGFYIITDETQRLGQRRSNSISNQ